MITAEVAHRYSNVLFNLDTSEKILQTRCALLNGMMDVFRKDLSLMQFFTSPQISKESKAKILRTVFSNYEDPVMLDFLEMLIEKNRFKFLPEIKREYIAKATNQLGILQGNLKSAAPLDKQVIDSLKSSLGKIYKKRIELKEFQDPSLIGGGVLYIDNKLADFSLKGKLERLKNHLHSKKI